MPKTESPAQHDSRPRPAVKTEFPALETVTRPAVETAAAAYYLNRAQQTLRLWAMREDGPVRPLRINGRLAWPVADLKRVLGVAA